MEEKKDIKIRILICLLIISIIVIITMGICMYKLNNDKTAEVQKSTELQAQVNTLNSTASDLQDKIDSISNTNVSEKNEKQFKELSDSEKEELFNKAIKEQMVLVDDMISTKDFSNKDFSDKEIVLMLPDSSESNIFSTYNDDESGIYKKASIDEVEKSAKKLFDKTINVKSVQNCESIRIINEDVIVDARSGVGILNAELLSIDLANNNDEYIIKFNFISGSGNEGTYKLTVNYNQGNVIYRSLEK